MSSQTVGLDALLTVDEVAQALRVSAQFVYRHASDGDLPSVSVGKAVWVRLSVVQAVIDRDLVLGRPRRSGLRKSGRLAAP